MTWARLAPLDPKTPDYEHLEQARFFTLLTHINHEATALTFAVPNQAVGKTRSKGTRLRYWKEGVKGGIADTLCLYPGKDHPFLAMEFKRPGGKVTAQQLRFLDACRKAGGEAVIVFSAQEAFKTWLDYLGLEARFS